VHDGDRRIGTALLHGSTVDIGEVVVLARLDRDAAADRKQAGILRGEADGGASRPSTAPHTLIRARATVTTRSPMA
jgi:hypothetical protein